MSSLYSPHFRNNIVIPKIADSLTQLLLTVSFFYLKLHFCLSYQENEMTQLDI